MGGLVAHAHRALQDSFPVSQTFTTRLSVFLWSLVSEHQFSGHSVARRPSPRFFSRGYTRFSPATNFIPPFRHVHHFHFSSSDPEMVRQAWPVGIHAIHIPSIKGPSTHFISRPALCRTGVQDFF